MTWQAQGKHKNGKAGKLTIVGPNDEEAARESLKGSHPDFTVTSIAPLDAAKPAAAAKAADDHKK